MILAIVHLFRSPYSASNCEVIPETGEYAIGAAVGDARAI